RAQRMGGSCDPGRASDLSEGAALPGDSGPRWRRATGERPDHPGHSRLAENARGHPATISIALSKPPTVALGKSPTVGLGQSPTDRLTGRIGASSSRLIPPAHLVHPHRLPEAPGYDPNYFEILD